MTMFNVTYEIVTPESAEQGDADERGFIGQAMRLRDAVGEVRDTRTSRVDGVFAIEWSGYDKRWLTIYNGMEFETGATESRSLHIPDHVTDASRARIGRLLGAR